jgi:hypothetical protein
MSREQPVVPKPGEVLKVDGRASVQFGGDRRLVLRVTSVSDKPTYDGWAWITGCVLNRRGEAVERRELFVQLDGLQLAEVPPPTTRSVRGRRV